MSSRETRAGAHLQALLVVAWLCLCSVLPAGAQVSGYLYVTMLSGYNLVANPFNARIGAAIDNSLTNVLRRVPDGTYAYAWDSGSQSFRGAIYSTNTGWSTSFDLPPSAGFVIKANSRWTNIFAGLVPTGTTNITILGGNKFSLVASYLYLAQPASLSALDFPVVDGENVYVYKAPNQSYADAVTWFDGYGWFDPAGVVDINGPVISAAQSFFVQNPGNTLLWSQSTGAGASAAPAAKVTGASGSSGATVGNLLIGPGKVTLGIANPGGQPYSVQFSTDGSRWTTLDTGQTGSTWSGPLAGGGQGFYRVAQP